MNLLRRIFITAGSYSRLSRLKPVVTRKYCLILSSENEKLVTENAYAFDVVKRAGVPDIHSPSEALSLLDCAELVETNVDKVKSQLEQLSIDELATLIPVAAKHQNSQLFLPLWKAIDLEGSKRIPSGDAKVILAGALKIIDEKLLIYRSEWIWSSLKRFCRRPDRLELPQMLQLMFLVNIIRRIPVQYSGFNVQHYLVGFFDDMTLDQMAVVCLAFFKSKTRMSNQVIMSKLMRKLLEECHDCHDKSLTMIAKILRYSMPLSLSDELYLLQDRLVGTVPNMPSHCLTHVALSGTNALICHDGLLAAITERFLQCLPDMRLKDMERLLLVLSLFDLQELSRKAIEPIIDELAKREDEIVKYPKSLLCLVNYLCILRHYDFSLIDRVLAPKFIDETFARSFRRVGTELIFIDQSVAIERPDYHGHRLSHKILKSSAKVMTYKGLDTDPGMSGTQRFSFELEGVLGDIYGRPHIKFISLLPQFHFPDFVLGLNSGMEPVIPPSNYFEHRWGEIKYAPDDDNVWLAFIVGGWNTLIRNKNTPLGTTRAKQHLLRKLGYHPIYVPYNMWRTSTDKLNYLKSIIEPEIKEIYSQRKQPTKSHG